MRYTLCMNGIVKALFLTCVALPWPESPLEAQRDNPLNPIIGTTRQDSVPTGIIPLDTLVPMTYVLLGAPDRKYTFWDTFSWEDVRQLPIRFDRAYLGNYGSATRTLTPGLDQVTTGFSTGWQQYDPYYLHESSFRYYSQDIPVTHIRFTQASQEDNLLHLDFGRSFAQGIHFSLAYRRINQLGEFNYQRQKNTALGVGVWYRAPSGRYNAYYNFISNGAVVQENGGISAPELIGTELVPDVSVPTFLSNGLTTHKHRLFLTQHLWHLTRDSAELGIDFWMKGRTGSGLFSYSDSRASTIPAYYPAAYLTDSRGIRQFTFITDHQVSAGMSMPWRPARSVIHASLRYRNIRLEQEPVEGSIHETYFEGGGDFQWIEPLQLMGRFSLGLGQAEGNFSFRADGILTMGIIGHLKGHWGISRRQPSLVESSLYVSQVPVYQTSFDHPLIHEWGVQWEVDEQKLKAGVTWMMFDHLIYFDSSRVPRQLESSFSLLRFFIRKKFDFKWFGVIGDIIWQPDARAELAIPTLMYTTGVYGRVKLFDRKVTMIPGIDITYHDRLSGNSYFPVTGTYHLTSGPPIPEYWRIDAGLGMEIRFLKVFIRMDDIAGAFKSRVLYDADFYPHYRGYLRLGIEAGFFN